MVFDSPDGGVNDLLQSEGGTSSSLICWAA